MAIKMLETLRNEYFGNYTLFGLVVNRYFPLQKVLILFSFGMFIFSLFLGTPYLTNHNYLEFAYFAFMALLWAAVTAALGNYFTAQTIRRILPQYYISTFSWDKQGLKHETKKNLKNHYKERGIIVSKEEGDEIIRKKKENGLKAYDGFVSFMSEILETFLKALRDTYPTKLPWVLLLLLCAIGFFECFRYCWMDIYENFLTDIGTLQRHQDNMNENPITRSGREMLQPVVGKLLCTVLAILLPSR